MMERMDIFVHYGPKRGRRARTTDCGATCSCQRPAADERSWVEVRSSDFEKMVVGKRYRFGTRVGRVIAKSESPGANAAGYAMVRPMVQVEWD